MLQDSFPLLTWQISPEEKSAAWLRSSRFLKVHPYIVASSTQIFTKNNGYVLRQIINIKENRTEKRTLGSACIDLMDFRCLANNNDLISRDLIGEKTISRDSITGEFMQQHLMPHPVQGLRRSVSWLIYCLVPH